MAAWQQQTGGHSNTQGKLPAARMPILCHLPTVFCLVLVLFLHARASKANPAVTTPRLHLEPVGKRRAGSVVYHPNAHTALLASSSRRSLISLEASCSTTGRGSICTHSTETWRWAALRLLGKQNVLR